MTVSGHEYIKGGLTAHLLRRMVHLASILLLWIYYQYGGTIADHLNVSLAQLVWIYIGLVIVGETMRISLGWTIFGQRSYEQNHISAFAWGAVSMGLVVLLTTPIFAVPIITAYAIGDPLLGELRQTSLPKLWVIIIGILVISTIWYLSSLWLGTPLWLALLMGPITVAAEWPCLKWIDDNALMQLAPLLIVEILFYFQPLVIG